MDIKAFPALNDVNPEGYRELAFVKDFRNIKSGVTINTDNLILSRENRVDVLDWIYNLQGRFENIPAQITSDSGTVYPYYLDLKDIKIGLDTATLGIQERKSHKHFFDNADFLTFELMRANGFLPDNMSVKVPYIIIPEDVELQRAVILMQTFALLFQLYYAIKELAYLVADFLSVGIGTLTAVAKLAALVVHFALLVVALIQNFQQLKELYFPTVRYLKAYSDFTLIRQGCLYLGYELDSSLLSNDLKHIYTMGKPQAVPGKSIFQFTQNQQINYFNKGYPTAEDTVPTLGSMIDYVLKTFNARIFVYDGIAKLERRSYFVDNANVVIVPTMSDQEGHDDAYRFNEDETWGRKYDHWQVDFSDAHSSDISSGIKSEHITEPIQSLNTDLVRLTGLKENSAPFSLAGRKNGFTLVEQRLIPLFGLYDTVVGAFNGSSNAVAGILARDGVMVISQQYFDITKKLWLEVDTTQATISASGVGKQPAWYLSALSMDNIYNLFKLDLQVLSNNRKVRTMRVPFTDTNFTSLLQNNFCILEPTGEIIELVNIEWFDRKYYANIIFLQADASAFNTKTTTLV